MTDLPIPPKGRFRSADNKWGPAMLELLKGNVLMFPDRRSEAISGNLRRSWIINQGFAVRTIRAGTGTIAWIERRKKK